ncbi:MAG: type II toxin-antitoxin system PemK/MazF family toxin [Gracilimonas sp.]
MKNGDIVLVPFPFTDLSGSKNRPAFIIFADDLDATLCFISTQLKWKEKTDLILSPSKLNGLKKKSLLRLSKIATIKKDLVLGKIGELNASKIQEVNSNLKDLFDL